MVLALSLSLGSTSGLGCSETCSSQDSSAKKRCAGLVVREEGTRRLLEGIVCPALRVQGSVKQTFGASVFKVLFGLKIQ